MLLTRLLNACHHFPGFVYAGARLIEASKTIEIEVRPRVGSHARCSGCEKPARGYDQLPQRLNNKAKVTMRKAYGYRTFRIAEISLFHVLGKLPEPTISTNEPKNKPSFSFRSPRAQAVQKLNDRLFYIDSKANAPIN